MRMQVINSLDPVLQDGVVVSVAPNFNSNETVGIDLCSSASCNMVSPLKQAPGIVHWVLPSSLDEFNYSLCTDTLGCGSRASLNAAELWWHQCVGWPTATRAQSSNGSYQFEANACTSIMYTYTCRNTRIHPTQV